MRGLDDIWAKTSMAGPDDCWLWRGRTGQRGYPSGWVNGRSSSLRRAVWQLANGRELSHKERVTSTCETKLCVNPVHLTLTPWHDDEARFWTFVQKTDTCWLWTGAKFRKDYGAFRSKGKIRHAHRYSYELAHGVELTDIQQVLMHTCDNPPCVNPAHLRLGTHADNVADMIAKGRNSRGEKHAALCAAGRKVS